MLKTVIAGIVAFVVSMAIAVGAVMMLGDDDVSLANALAESVASDSAHAEVSADGPSGTALEPSLAITGEPGDSAGLAAIADTLHADSAAAEQPSPALAAVEGDTVAGAAASTKPPSGSPVVTVVLTEGTAADSARQARLGRIFASMQPREAAKVLEQMDDGDVIRILGMLQERQAAAVMASLPAPRAAAISRSGLIPAGTAP